MITLREFREEDMPDMAILFYDTVHSVNAVDYSKEQLEELLAEINLADFLAANPMIDCSKQEVLIPIRIEFKAGAIKVTVPEWYVEQVKPEF